MRTLRPLLLLGLLATVLTVALALPAQPARAENEPSSKPNVRAWNVRADFTGASAVVLLTVYSAYVKPPHAPVIDTFVQTDISSLCYEDGGGSITYNNGKATFDGSVALVCELPGALLASVAEDQCQDEAASFFYFSFDGKLQNSSTWNPIIAASDATFRFSLPSTGIDARARAQLSTTVYQSSLWSRDNTGNEVLIGQYGPLMIEVSDEIAPLLSHMSNGWKPFFNGIDATEVGQRMASSMGNAFWTTSASPLPYNQPPPAVIFGYDPGNSTFYDGKLTYAEVDPPGCTVK